MKRITLSVVTVSILLVGSWTIMALHQQHEQVSKRQTKTVTVQGEIVDLSCYLSHGAKGESHAKCAIACINKGLPMGILTVDGKLFVVLEDHAKADAYQQVKKFTAKQAKLTGMLYTRNGITGIAVQKVETASTIATAKGTTKTNISVR